MEAPDGLSQELCPGQDSAAENQLLFLPCTWKAMWEGDKGPVPLLERPEKQAELSEVPFKVTLKNLNALAAPCTAGHFRPEREAMLWLSAPGHTSHTSHRCWGMRKIETHI